MGMNGYSILVKTSVSGNSNAPNFQQYTLSPE